MSALLAGFGTSFWTQEDPAGAARRAGVLTAYWLVAKLQIYPPFGAGGGGLCALDRATIERIMLESVGCVLYDCTVVRGFHHVIRVSAFSIQERSVRPCVLRLS